VLRLKAGDECEVVVGAAVYAATVLPGETGGRGGAVQVRLEERLEGRAAGAVYRLPVALVQAVSRPSALDWSVEKSTETGASLILLVQAAGSPRWPAKDSEARVGRWARIAREAAKQSKQPAVPPVELASSFAAARRRLQTLGLSSILLDPAAEQTLYDQVRLIGGSLVPPDCAKEAPRADGGSLGIALWVGPESGWTEEEREGLLGAGLVTAKLGEGILRTETAGPVAVAVARLALRDW
jgi:16S rRNA (uracil1498-N3)-methyltransferase